MKWVDCDENGKIVYKNIPVVEGGELLVKALTATAAGIGKPQTVEQAREFVLKDLRTCKGNTWAEYNELRIAWGYEPEQSPEEIANEHAHNLFFREKPQPSPKHYRCGKCGGTGRFVLYFENGRPKSNTGYDCYSCGGAGWKIRKNRK